MLQGAAPHSIDAELALQRKLAKQLGLKSKAAAKVPELEDNLDEFLVGEHSVSNSCAVSAGLPVLS